MDNGRTIVITCTDADRHRERIIRSWLVDSTTTAEVMAQTLPGAAIELDCPLCPRTPRLSHHNFVTLCGYLLNRIRAGEHRVTLDVSKLPL